MRRLGKANADIMFDPKWWNKHYDIDFGQRYYDDYRYRVEAEQFMKRSLFERFGDLGLGEEHPDTVPVISTQHCPMCYIIGEMFGCDVRWESNQGAWVREAKLSGEVVDQLAFHSIFDTPIMQKLVKEMDALETEYGYVAGDINPQGILNNSYRVRGEDIFLDMVDAPERVHRLHQMITDAMIEFGSYMRDRTNTAAVSVTNIVEKVHPTIFVSSNCMRIMIAPDHWEEFVLPYEEQLAAALKPFGMHDCGDNVEHYAAKYIKNALIEFVEIGWGSDIVKCRELLPLPIHINARYSPIEMRELDVDTVYQHTYDLVQTGKPHKYFSVSVVAVDDTVPDDIIRAYFRGADDAWEESN
jgi:hypothetical protein